MLDPYQQILSELSACKRILVTTHVRPDGDALGSVAAMILGLQKKNIHAEALLLSHLPSKYAFIFKDHNIPFHDAESGWPADLDLNSFDAILVLDTGTWSQLPGLKDRVENWPKPKLVVDHHLTQENWATHKLVIKEAAAAAEIVAELLELWDIKIDSPIATALYLAIVSDTGWFQFSNTRPFTMRLAATLMEAGVDTDRLYQLLYQNERAPRILLQARATQNMQLLADNKLAVITVTKQDFIDLGAKVTDTENLINIPLQIATVQASILITEPQDFGPVRVSLRSKGQIDCAEFAQQFAGGGHARAAGLKLEGSLEEARSRVVSAMLARIG
ncbi:MAG TPA: DHH family phosphoesterase [Tepidisphaeraceae bacterium]|jgi:phosphoesterase RecJ-like protein|nr:DHH family phosphoesterase [Tepidisphaeraceae bacterium]